MRKQSREVDTLKAAAEMVRNYRTRRGITQAHIERAAGLTPGKLYSIETGYQRMNADDFLKIIVLGFGITPQIFFDEQFSENEQNEQTNLGG